MKSTISNITSGSVESLAGRVGSTLRAARIARGLTQAELARPYTAAFVSRVEHGDVIPSLSSLATLTAAFSMSLEEFFRRMEHG